MRLPDHPNAATGRDYSKVTFDGRQNRASYVRIRKQRSKTLMSSIADIGRADSTRKLSSLVLPRLCGIFGQRF
jgi:hypothetical protein